GSQCRRGMRTLSYETSVQHQAFITNAKSSAKTRRTHTDQIEQRLRESVGLAAPGRSGFIKDGNMVLLPSSIEQRDQSMIEKIEKRRERIVLCRLTGQHALCVIKRQNALDAGETHERHGHLCRILGIAIAFDVVNRAWWKCHRLTCLVETITVCKRHEPREFLRRFGDTADLLPVRKQPGQQAGSLEKFEFVTVIEQSFF